VCRVLARLKRPDVAHSLVSSIGDHVEIRLEVPDSKQAIVTGRLLLGRNTEPFVVGIEGFGRGTLLIGPNSLCGGLYPLYQGVQFAQTRHAGGWDVGWGVR
jgi:hypothetical protein